MGFQGLQLLKTALKKKKIIIVELMHPDFETYYEATVIKTTPTHTGIQIDRHKNRFNIFVRHF